MISISPKEFFQCLFRHCLANMPASQVLWLQGWLRALADALFALRAVERQNELTKHEQISLGAFHKLSKQVNFHVVGDLEANLRVHLVTPPHPDIPDPTGKDHRFVRVGDEEPFYLSITNVKFPMEE